MKFLILLICILYSQNSFGKKLILALGEKAWIEAPANQQVRIGDKSLVALQGKGALLSLTARRQGQTLLVTGETRYEIFIFNKGQKKQAVQLNKILQNLWGLSWSFSEEKKFQIKGRLYRLHDWVELANISRLHNIQYEFKATTDEELKKTISHYFKKIFKNPIEIAWSHLPLAYIPKTKNLIDYQKQLKPFGLIPKEKSLWFSQAPFIEIEISVVESLSSSTLAFGGYEKTSGGETTYPSPHFSSLLSFLNFLKSSGKGKTLYHSSVVSQSGQKLHIQSGGQIPFSSYNMKTEQKNTQWRSHGLDLILIPTAGKNNQIELEIKAKISEPLSLGSMDSPPPLKTQSLESQLVLKNKQILKLFQLNKRSKGRQFKSLGGWLTGFPNSLLTGNNKHQTIQTIFIQAKILENIISFKTLKDSSEKLKNNLKSTKELFK